MISGEPSDVPSDVPNGCAPGDDLPHDEQPDLPPGDDKDWTWVITSRCPECGFDPAAVAEADLPARLRATVPRWTAVLRWPDATRRPEPQVWSPLEYAAHIRDVYLLFASRARLMLDEADPVFENWDQDRTAVEKRYWESDPAGLADELRAAGEAAAQLFADVPAASWRRQGFRSNGSVFTVATLGVYFLHDVDHHLNDVSG